MQFLSIDANTKLPDISDRVGARNTEAVLVANQLKRAYNIGEQFVEKCYKLFEQAAVTSYQKINILNTLTSANDAFEKAALMDDNEWKVYSNLNTFQDAIRLPSSVKIPYAADVIGNDQSVSSSIYQKTMKQLRDNGFINPAIFSDYAAGSLGAAHESTGTVTADNDVFSAFRIPWGSVQIYSSISQETMDFPCYPEELEYTRGANYGEMDSLLYQYEPWYVYESSGPREQSLTFMLHRDMWTGNHLDGKCNELIRFCEANCYPDYNGAAVNTPLVTIYIAGTAFITGVMTQVTPHWQGPIGQDGWYLQCELTITLNEVAAAPLNYKSIRKMNVIGGYSE